jgi:hypothetical protein
MHERLGIRDGQKQCTKLKNKETRALKERKELTTIAGKALQESTFEPMSKKRKRVEVRGF